MSLFKVLLINPKIPQNTGNIARTCVANDIELHLAGELGFSLEDKYLKRAGLDYWKHLKIFTHSTYQAYLDFDINRGSYVKSYFFTKFATKLYYKINYEKGSTIVFGSEDKGIPKQILQDHKEFCLKIPMLTDKVRSLNLSNSVAIVSYELIRQLI